jgi:hypothetical protein
VDDPLNIMIGDATRRARPGLVELAIQALGEEAGAPLADGLFGDVQFTGDGSVGQAAGTEQNDASANRESLRRLATPRPTLQRGTFRGTEGQTGKRSTYVHQVHF